jgi:hypothetical protein
MKAEQGANSPGQIGISQRRFGEKRCRRGIYCIYLTENGINFSERKKY